MLPKINFLVEGERLRITRLNKQALDLLGVSPKTFGDLPFLGRRESDVEKMNGLVDALTKGYDHAIEIMLPNLSLKEEQRLITNAWHFWAVVSKTGKDRSKLCLVDNKEARDLSNRDHKFPTVHNARYGWEHCIEQLEKGLNLALCFADVDRFKWLNDIYMQDGGDLLLEAICYIISQHVREDSMAFREGGDELVVALVVSDPADIQRKGEALMRRIQFHLSEDLEPVVKILLERRARLLAAENRPYYRRKIRRVSLPPSFSYGMLNLTSPLYIDPETTELVSHTAHSLKGAASALMKKRKAEKQQIAETLKVQARFWREVKEGAITFDETTNHWYKDGKVVVGQALLTETDRRHLARERAKEGRAIYVA